MKKTNLLALIATMALAASMTACGSKAEEVTNVSEPVVKSHAEVTEPTVTPVESAESSPEAPVSGEDDLDAKMEAFNLMIDELNADSDYQKMELFHIILQYCIWVNGGQYSEGIPHEEALAQMQDFLPAGDVYNAFVAFMNDNSEEIMSGYVAEAEIWYTDDFDSLYNKFLSYQQTATATVDTIEKALTNISMADNTIFSENGVTFTYDYYDAKTQKMFFTLENNNDSNKKVFLHIDSIYINGVEIFDEYVHLYNASGVGRAEDGIENGNTVQFSYNVGTLGNIDKLYTNLGTNYIDSPFETVQFDYEIQIGSNSDWVYDSALMQTTLYNSNSFSSLFGEHFTTLEVTKEYTTEVNVVETYGKFSDTTCVFYVKGITSGAGEGETRIGDLLMNESKLTNNTDYTMYNLSDGVLFIVNRSEDELRKQCEIGNDEPLNVNLDMNFALYTIFTK